MAISAARSTPQLGGDAPVWRHMRVEHLEDMVASATLYMRRLDCLDAYDPHEGTWLPGAEGVLSTSGSDPQAMRDSLEAGRERLFVSCWTRGLEDRYGMWHRWCVDEPVVALRSTWGDLWRGLEPGEDSCVLGGVRYTDDIARFLEWFPLANAFNLAFCKRLMFEQEKEVRVAHLSEDENPPEGFRVAIDLTQLKAQVVVPTHAPGDLNARVQNALGNVGWTVARPPGKRVS